MFKSADFIVFQLTDYILGAEEVLGLCNFLWTNTTVTKLNLSSLKKEWQKRGIKNSGQKQTDNIIVDEGAKLISEVLKVNTTLSELCFTRQWWKSMIYERINHLFLLNRKPDGNRRNRCIVWDASGQHNTSKTGNKS